MGDRWQYLALMGACLLLTLPLEFVLRARVYRRPLRLVLALLPTIVVFVVWDVVGILRHHWSYSPRFTTGVMLAIARVIGETAPLLITAGFTDALNMNLFDGRMQTLPVYIYSQYAYKGIPPEAYVDRAWAAALTLILIVMALNLVARLVAKLFAPKTGR